MRPDEPLPSTELESALREMFSRRSATLPPSANPVDQVLRRARRRQRRRATLGTAMVAFATVAASMFVPQIAANGGDDPPPAFLGTPGDDRISADPSVDLAFSPPPAQVRRVEPPLVDVVVGHALHSERGQLIDLSSIGRVVTARRSGDGWLLVTLTPSAASNLWFVREGVAPQRLLAGADQVVLADDGSRVAWQAGREMQVAPVTDGRLGTASPEVLPADGRLVRFVDDGVLLARERGGASDGYAMWWPRQARRVPDWEGSVTAVYGLLPDRRTLIGRARVESEPRPCLALLDAARNLLSTKVTCTPALALEETGVVSPDGRWLIANRLPDRTGAAGPRDSAEQAFVVDLATVFEKQPVVAEFDFRLEREVAWTTPDTLVQAGRQGDLVRVAVAPVTVGKDPQVVRVPVPLASAGDWMVVVPGCTAGPTTSAEAVVSC